MCNRRCTGALTRFWCSSSAPKSGLKQIDFPATVHLPSHELEAGDLTSGLSVGPRSDSRPNRRGCALREPDAPSSSETHKAA
jgi:hypothetical protein